MSYGVAYGHLSGRIHAGRLNKAGTAFISKDDCTIPVALAVVEWVTKQHAGEVELTPKTGGPAYRIMVEVIGEKP